MTFANEPGDVRMRGFASRVSVEDALAWIDANARTLANEPCPLEQAAGRVLAEEVRSEVNVPNFRRAMMDGYAVRAEDTLGATNYNPLPLRCLDVILPGQSPTLTVEAGACIRIMTGAPVPDGANAVLPAEYARVESDAESIDEQASNATVSCLGEVSPGKHVGLPGEDIAAGAVVASPGRRLRPQDLGVLASIGVASPQVVRRPRVRLVITGDELLEPGSNPEGVKIVDANSPMLQALVRRDGGEPIHPGLIPDRAEAIAAAMQDDADIVLVSGGSSVGQEDHAPRLLAELGQLAIHGVAVRPASPAGMGRLDSRLIFLLPGNPVSCLCAYDLFAGRAIRLLGGREPTWSYRTQRLRLARKLVSQIGRVDYARVRITEQQQVEPLAISGASVLSSTTRADGFVLVPADSEGFAPNTEVDVWFYGEAQSTNINRGSDGGTGSVS